MKWGPSKIGSFKALSMYFRAGSRSLKTALALYFIPISILPTLFISIYATRIFEESNRENLNRRAASERAAFLAEIESFETDLLSQARSHATTSRLLASVRLGDRRGVEEFLNSLRQNVSVRIFRTDGQLLASRKVPGDEPYVPYIAKEGLKRVMARGETLDRYPLSEGKGFLIQVRILLRDKDRFYGVLEEEYHFGVHDLAELKNRRQVDVVILDPNFSNLASSFAISQEDIKGLSTKVIQSAGSGPGTREPVYARVGDSRYATFLYDLPGPFSKVRRWGYVAVFLSMTAADLTVDKLKLAMIYLTVLLILVAALLIFIFSNRLVRPIEVLVSAMKRVKTGRVEQIPTIDSPYEIEYLVHSFNEMTRNVSAAKRALEIKLEELNRANLEIKTTQSTLVQSAKMISLGQIVAGVALRAE